MKEIEIVCPKCNTKTIYHRDNTSFYFKLIMVICISFAIGVLLKEAIGHG